MSEYNPFSLKDKRIMVTGASSGIGRSIAIECSKMGAEMIIVARSEDKLKDTMSEMSSGKHLLLTCDLTCTEDVARLVAELPLLDGVVHNAGVGKRVVSKMVKETDLDYVMRTNVYAPIMLQKELLKKRRMAKESSIVFVASRAPYAPSIGNGIYSASKGAILGYAKVLALELAAQGIRVNSILPAMVWTDFINKDAALMGVDYGEVEKRYPLKRFGKPVDVAYLAAYLLSGASSWMTGSSIDLTGGGEGILTM